jgi:hypothetical protein
MFKTFTVALNEGFTEIEINMNQVLTIQKLGNNKTEIKLIDGSVQIVEPSEWLSSWDGYIG